MGRTGGSPPLYGDGRRHSRRAHLAGLTTPDTPRNSNLGRPMLTITSHVPAIAAASRRALKAAAVTIELSGGRLEDCSIGTGGLPPTCIYHSTGRLLLIPTCA